MRKNGFMTAGPTTICMGTSRCLNFFLKQIEGKVVVEQWGVIRLPANKSNWEKGELELHEVLDMPGMQMNIFSFERIRSKGA